ncbi:MAG: hypothetical protein IH626_21050 [Rhodospirillales bacterium]|nr:hypothetical protein [Rhodospirillales bacterium]
MTNTTTKTTKATETSTFQLAAQKLDAMSKERQGWEIEEFARSNQRLYKILQGCYEILLNLSGKAKQLALFDEHLTALGQKFQSTTPLATKIVRAVFATERRRAHTYSAVLRRAKKDRVDLSKLPDWISEMGGVEEIRLGESKPQAESQQQRQVRQTTFAVSVLENKRSLAKVKSPTNAPDAENGFVLLLGVVSNDGSISVADFAYDPNGTLCKKALANYGKKIEEDKGRKTLDAEKAAAEQRDDDALAAAVATPKSDGTANETFVLDQAA